MKMTHTVKSSYCSADKAENSVRTFLKVCSLFFPTKLIKLEFLDHLKFTIQIEALNFISLMLIVVFHLNKRYSLDSKKILTTFFSSLNNWLFQAYKIS